MSDETTVPVWYDDMVVVFRVLDRSEAKEILDDPYDVSVEDCIMLVAEAAVDPEITEDMAREMEVGTLARFSKHILPDPGVKL